MFCEQVDNGFAVAGAHTNVLAPLVDALNMQARSDNDTQDHTQSAKREERECTDLVSALRVAVEGDRDLAGQVCCPEVFSSLLQVENRGIFNRSFGAACEVAMLLEMLASSPEMESLLATSAICLLAVAEKVKNALSHHSNGAVARARLDHALNRHKVSA